MEWKWALREAKVELGEIEDGKTVMLLLWAKLKGWAG